MEWPFPLKVIFLLNFQFYYIFTKNTFKYTTFCAIRIKYSMFGNYSMEFSAYISDNGKKSAHKKICKNIFYIMMQIPCKLDFLILLKLTL